MTAHRSVALVILMFAIFAEPIAAGAQPAGKLYQVGVLCPVTCAVPPIEALRQGLRERGYVEGRNITFAYRWADGKYEKFPDLTAELAGLQVDVIVASGGLPGALAAQRATTKIPVVFAALGEDPVHYGLVQSLAGVSVQSCREVVDVGRCLVCDSIWRITWSQSSGCHWQKPLANSA